MRSDFIAAALGNGLNAFADSYLEGQKVQQSRLEAEERRSLARAAQKTKEDNEENAEITGIYNLSNLQSQMTERGQASPAIEALLKERLERFNKRRAPQAMPASPELTLPLSGSSDAPMSMPSDGKGLVKDRMNPSELMNKPPAKAPMSAPKEGLIRRATAGVIEQVGPTRKEREFQDAVKKAVAIKKATMDLEKTAVKALPAETVLALSQGKNMPQMLSALRSSIAKHKGLMGPVQGLLNKQNPYNVDAQDLNSSSQIVKQMIGKYIEGGILRKEDEAKYAKMIPGVNTDPAVAEQMLDNLQDTLERDVVSKIEGLRGSGYNTSAFDDAVVAIKSQYQNPGIPDEEWEVLSPKNKRLLRSHLGAQKNADRK